MERLATMLLMKLQYEFPLTLTPYGDVARSLSIDEETVLSMLRELKAAGLVKRVGFYYNYRSRRQVAALIGVACRDYARVAEAVRRDPLVTHSFVRDHPEVNLWIVARRGSRSELIEYAEELARLCESSRYTVLFSKKTFKLSVKYDLLEGVSRSGPYSSLPEDPPSPEDLGVDPRVPEMLRSLPIESRPYKAIGEKLGLSEDEVFESMLAMLRSGVLGDPGASLDGRKLGFTENAMVVAVLEGSESLAECLASIPYTTHVVLREIYPPGSWSFDGYAMVHATSRDKIRGVVETIRGTCGVRDLSVLFSIVDLKPEVVR